MRRGEIWWADLPLPVGRRPVLLLSRDRAYAVRSAVTVAFITTTIRGIPVEVPIGPTEGMPKDCVINLDLINTIPKASLAQRTGQLLLNRQGTKPPRKERDSPLRRGERGGKR